MSGLDATPLVVTVAILAYFVAGVAKGLSGLGMQAICVPALALVAPLETAIGLGLLPAFVTSLWQGLFLGALRKVLQRTWSFLLPCCAMIFVGASFLASMDRALLSGILGVLLFSYAIYALTRPALPALGRHEIWVSPLMGALTGVAAGATGTMVMPGAPYYQLLRLDRTALVQALSFGAIAVMPVLAVALGRNRLFSESVQLASVALLLPTIVGLWLGTGLRGRISDAGFRRLFFWVLLMLGAAIAIRNLPL